MLSRALSASEDSLSQGLAGPGSEGGMTWRPSSIGSQTPHARTGSSRLSTSTFIPKGEGGHVSTEAHWGPSCQRTLCGASKSHKRNSELPNRLPLGAAQGSQWVWCHQLGSCYPWLSEPLAKQKFSPKLLSAENPVSIAQKKPPQSIRIAIPGRASSGRGAGEAVEETSSNHTFITHRNDSEMVKSQGDSWKVVEELEL